MLFCIHFFQLNFPFDMACIFTEHGYHNKDTCSSQSSKKEYRKMHTCFIFMHPGCYKDATMHKNSGKQCMHFCIIICQLLCFFPYLFSSGFHWYHRATSSMLKCITILHSLSYLRFKHKFVEHTLCFCNTHSR